MTSDGGVAPSLEVGEVERPIISVDPNMIQAGESIVTQIHSCYKAASPSLTISQNAVSKANESGGISEHIMPA